MKNCKGDAKELQPTIMAGVPEVFERIRKTVEAQVNKQGLFAKYLFRLAYAFRSKLIEYSSTPHHRLAALCAHHWWHTLTRSCVGSQRAVPGPAGVQEGEAGAGRQTQFRGLWRCAPVQEQPDVPPRVRRHPARSLSALNAQSSGRRRSRASHGPFRCFGVQVVQGYGTLAVTDLCSCGTPLTVSLLVWCPALTETAGAGTLQAYDDPTFSNVGRPNMCCGACSCREGTCFCSRA